MDTQTFLAGIQDADADKRFAAWRAASDVPPSVIPQLGKLAGSPNPGVAKAAREALTTMTHGVGKDPRAANRAAVVRGLIELTGAAYSLPVRVHAFRLLSNIAGEDSVAAIAREIHNPDLREEVVYCLERIPGEAPLRALQSAFQDAAAEFKPRILAALGHRRAAAAADLCAGAMKSPSKDLAIAAAKAFARIGSPAPAEFPPEEGLSEWQKIERLDSLLRWADAQVAAGNAAGAMPVYRSALERKEEHWQCAALIGLAKIRSADAAAIILSRLDSPLRNVRITARQAWKSMAG